MKAIIEFAGLRTEVIPTFASSFERVAAVSNNEAAVNSRSDGLNYKKMPDWKDALYRYIKHIRNQL